VVIMGATISPAGGIAINDAAGPDCRGRRRGWQDQDHAAASSGMAGRTAASASSALILAARAFSAWLVISSLN